MNHSATSTTTCRLIFMIKFHISGATHKFIDSSPFFRWHKPSPMTNVFQWQSTKLFDSVCCCKRLKSLLHCKPVATTYCSNLFIFDDEQIALQSQNDHRTFWYKCEMDFGIRIPIHDDKIWRFHFEEIVVLFVSLVQWWLLNAHYGFVHFDSNKLWWINIFLLWYREKSRNELVNWFEMQFNWKISYKQQLIDAPSSQIYLYIRYFSTCLKQTLGGIVLEIVWCFLWIHTDSNELCIKLSQMSIIIHILYVLF